MNKAYIYHPDEGYFVGECLGLVFYQSSIKDGTLSPVERPIEFNDVDGAKDYMASWIASDGKAYITVTPPCSGCIPVILHQGHAKELPRELIGDTICY